jgi:hypothetical protein
MRATSGGRVPGARRLQTHSGASLTAKETLHLYHEPLHDDQFQLRPPSSGKLVRCAILLSFGFAGLVPLEARAQTAGSSGQKSTTMTTAGREPPVDQTRMIRFVPPGGQVKWFSEDEVRHMLGPERYVDFRRSKLSLDAWISEQNEESLGLTIAEVSTITLGALGLLAGGLLVLEGASSPDALGQGIGLGIGLPVLGVGAAFGGLGAYLVWEDKQDRGAVRHQELTGASSRAPSATGMGLTFSVRW